VGGGKGLIQRRRGGLSSVAMTTPQGEAAAAWLADKTPAIEATIAALVEVNSFTENVDGGRKVAALLQDAFKLPGLACRVSPSTKYADHLVFSSTSELAGRAPIALVGHLDTVFPPGTFEGYRRDGDLARGPGVLDMKGGLTLVAFALRALAESGGLGQLAPLRIVIVADEEIGSPEGQGVIQEAIRGASQCLVFEAGRAADAIITRRKGTGAVVATAHGIAAHAGNNHREGKNALWALSRFVDRVQGLTDYDRGITVNVGKVAGGQGKNTVPDRADAWIDVRFCTREDAESTLTAMRALAAQVGVEIAGTRVELDGGVARLPLEKSPTSIELMETYAKCAEASGLGFAEAPLIGGGSDASTSSAMGIASIDGLGPRGKGFHTKDEQIEVASLVPKAQALARFLALASA
jgi:glutamate carboxypeptidase